MAVRAALADAVCRICISPGKGDGYCFGRDQKECDRTITKIPGLMLESSTFLYLHPTSPGTCAVHCRMVARGWLAGSDRADTVEWAHRHE